MEQKRFSFLNFVEKLGNALPHPAMIFIYLTIILMVSSALASYFNLSVSFGDRNIQIVNLLSMESFVKFTNTFVENYAKFPPLGVVLVAMIGISIAEHSGYLKSILKALVLSAPKALVSFFVVLAGILSNLASDIGYVVLTPLAAMLFYSIGRHPLAGLAAAFAGVSGGYSANLLISTADPLLAGITQSAAQIINPNYVVGPEVNYYFMFVSTFLIAIVGALITDKIIEPRLGTYQEDSQVEAVEDMNAREKRAMILASLGALLYVAVVLVMILPQDSLFRNAETGSFIKSPFIVGIIFFVFFLLAIPGVIYGFLSGSFKTSTDVVNAMSEGMKTMAMYLVIIFFAAQFISLFAQSNIGQYTAIKGAIFLKNLDLNSGLLILLFIAICAFINLFVASASAQWALISPVFVPMFMLLGYAPELVQAAYRIGDSTTNIITPLLSYMPIILSFAMKYQKNVGMGTMISLMLPYSVAFFVSWSALLYAWVFIFNLPLGPGVENFISQ
ncbi:AbgT family transporter [Campylobacter upsaliensis]|uniref:Putative efflux pump component MtrF n=1 Tax=Campylobacter upsaliensis TaxID=28080 RepID=A0A448KPS3_CAMUP|nr:AbgT family transporter [Campylobacter upsaliensis]MCA5589146.1 AbgT family transporter [Campylobacter upsaliensis]VEG85392.1 putative efflux pump component MtrF [Campylobacter upsaliensis]